MCGAFGTFAHQAYTACLHGQLSSNVRPRDSLQQNAAQHSGNMNPLLLRTAVILALLISAGETRTSSQVFKCVINGSVTFQNSPCPVDKPVRPPTKDELNAERKKRLAESAAAAASAPRAASQGATSVPANQAASGDQAPSREPAFRCDGSQHCSQMRSCAEAKYFLANCPGVKMDGNRDGTPCEQQWCTHPFAK